MKIWTVRDILLSKLSKPHTNPLVTSSRNSRPTDLLKFLYLHTVVTENISPVDFDQTEGTGIYADCKQVHCNHSLENAPTDRYAYIVDISNKMYHKSRST